MECREEEKGGREGGRGGGTERVWQQQKKRATESREVNERRETAATHNGPKFSY